MPPRFAYWTILIDDTPTAFRARDAQDLMPTLNQLKRTNPNVVMKWFARGKLWDSQEAERESWRAARPPVEKRSRDWRPGGQHKDPRDRFKKKNRPERAWSDKPDRPMDVRRDRDKLGPPRESNRWRDRPAGPPRTTPPSDRPWQTKPTGPRRDRKPWTKPDANVAAPRGARPWSGKPSGPPRGDRPWSKPSGPPRGDRPGEKPSGPRRDDRPWRDRPRDSGPRERRPDKPRKKP